VASKVFGHYPALPISKEPQAYICNWTSNNTAVRGIWRDVLSHESDLNYVFERVHFCAYNNIKRVKEYAPNFTLNINLYRM